MPPEWAGLGEADVDDSVKRRIARDGAQQGFVLLRNEQSLLPLRRKALGAYSLLLFSERLFQRRFCGFQHLSQEASSRWLCLART